MAPDMPACQRVGKHPVPLHRFDESGGPRCHVKLVPAIVAVVGVPLALPFGVAAHGVLNLGFSEQRARKELYVERRVVNDHGSLESPPRPPATPR